MQVGGLQWDRWGHLRAFLTLPREERTEELCQVVATHLQALPFFSQLPELLVGYLCRSMRIVQVTKGTVFEETNCLIFI